eukprot:8657678-Pyramimonas_sp.AAC.1
MPCAGRRRRAGGRGEPHSPWPARRRTCWLRPCRPSGWPRPPASGGRLPRPAPLRWPCPARGWPSGSTCWCRAQLLRH